MPQTREQWPARGQNAIWALRVARVGVGEGGRYTVHDMRGSGAASDRDGRRRWRHYTGLREGARGTQAMRPSRYNDEEALQRRRLGACGKEEGRQIERGKTGQVR